MQVFPVFIPHLGCRNRCLFCAQDRSTFHGSQTSLAEIRAGLDHALPDAGIGEIAFYGGSFTLLPEPTQRAFLEMAREFLPAGRIAGIRISTRPDGLDGKALALLKECGVTTVEIGCQSFSDEVLQACERGHCAQTTIEAVRRCQAAGFQVGLQLMTGLPGGDETEALSSLRQALHLRPAFLRIYPTVVIDGTALAEHWRKGRFLPWSLEQAVDICAKMLLVCQQTQIPVIRLGLQQDPSLQANVLAGPHHPAFGQLVRSRIWRAAIARIPYLGSDLFVHPRELSDAVGHAGQNRQWVENRSPGTRFRPHRDVSSGVIRTGNREWSVLGLASKGWHIV